MTVGRHSKLAAVDSAPAPSGPIRLRQRVSELGSHGRSCWKYSRGGGGNVPTYSAEFFRADCLNLYQLPVTMTRESSCATRR